MTDDQLAAWMEQRLVETMRCVILNAREDGVSEDHIWMRYGSVLVRHAAAYVRSTTGLSPAKAGAMFKLAMEIQDDDPVADVVRELRP